MADNVVQPIIDKPYRVHVNRTNLFDYLKVESHHTVFVGDSITQRNEWSEMFNDPNIINRGIDSDNAAEVLSRLDQILIGKPKKLILMIGINDLFYNKTTDMLLDTHQEIIHRVKENSPDTELFIQSLLPVNNSKYAHPMDNQIIQTFNAELKQLAEKNVVRYIDLFDAFLNPAQDEMDELYTNDGAHLSGQGYVNWKKFLLGEQVIEEKPSPKLLPTKVDAFDSASHYNNRTSLFKELPLDNESIVFLGDSMSQRNEWREQFQLSNIANRGIDSDTTEGVYARLNQVLPYKPKKIFLMIGINDIANGIGPEKVLSNYEKIVSTITTESPSTELYAQSLLPVNNTFYNHPLDNTKVVDFNKKLEALTTNYDCTYINFYDEVKSHYTNELNFNYTGDGVHLSGEGYKVWVEQIKSSVLE